MVGKKSKDGKKETKNFGREELAAYLEDLARQVRTGTLREGDRGWSVPDEIVTKISLKEKKGRLSAKLSMGWETLSDYGQEDRAEVTSWKKSFKTVKKELGAAFKALQKAVEGGQLPDDKTLSGFIETAEAFSDMAHADWPGPVQDFRDHLENLKRAAGEGRLEMMVHEIRDLRNQMAECHREYK